MEFVSESTVALEQFCGGDIMVCRAAWVSNESERKDKYVYGVDGFREYRSVDPREEDEGRVEKLINFLYRNKHMSPFEHGIFTFYIETPIFVAREFMRHRTVSYNEMSGRYTELPGRFYVPSTERPLVQDGRIGAYKHLPGSEEQIGMVWASIQKANEDAWSHYQAMLAAGIAREVARDVLPVNTMTRFYATMNPRNLMQFLTLRTDPQALYEIREVAGKMEKLFETNMPLTYKAYKESNG